MGLVRGDRGIYQGPIRAGDIPELLTVAQAVGFADPGNGYLITRALEVDGIVGIANGTNHTTIANTATVRIEPTFTKSKKR